jgi:hypothetical protein
MSSKRFPMDNTFKLVNNCGPQALNKLNINGLVNLQTCELF